MTNEVTVSSPKERTEQMVKYINEYIPKVHHESLKLMIDENRKAQEDIAVKDKLIINLRDDNNLKSDRLDVLDEEVKNFQDQKSRMMIEEAELSKLIAENLRTQELANHVKEIADLELNCANQKTTLIKETMEIVFKPAALRSEIQKTIPMRENFYTTEYDGVTNKSVQVKSGEGIMPQPGSESKTEYDE